jgi:hypothetical protein
VHPNTQAYDDVWLVYERPADPGSILFVSNTVPTTVLLTLWIDAMCMGCFNSYGYSGNTATVSASHGAAVLVKIVELENKFGIGYPLLDAEKAGLAAGIADPLYHLGRDSVKAHVLKMPTENSYQDSVQYIAYFTEEIPDSDALVPVFRTKLPFFLPWRFDLLGRRWFERE